MADYALRRRMMVDTQVRPSDVTKFPVIDAMSRIKRELFVPLRLKEAAYLGENLPLARDRVILEPRTMAKMLDALDVSPTDLVLDLGPGMGYSAAVLAYLAEAVVAVEPDEMMASEAEAALSEAGIDNVAIHRGPLEDGLAKYGPYDVIAIEGAVDVFPSALADQLAEGGRVACIFMERALGVCRLGIKIDGRINWRYAFNASAPVLPGFAGKREFSL
ncbi:protein-L-isoaspartate(D-aspartate) O-methyltransferase [Palleronia aestuarii]|uniref:Protein-L-isoaspartate O-methyltransferase n=1 Tax=Palleronia aestuarii TaxID=568105 RepID=A0A2W7N7E4_9RHOB|nr:protein-L-isoaspartate O-methyltransferase [Palleronia aestuarii]PZX15990.1 protein-L-isoaspartate(D-aspartate) O-methyltransferase [Palleronia aestuarii]